MWIARRKFEELERKIAALEEEQLVITKYVKEAMKSDQELTEIVKNFREELLRIEISDTNVAEQLSQVGKIKHDRTTQQVQTLIHTL